MEKSLDLHIFHPPSLYFCYIKKESKLTIKDEYHSSSFYVLFLQVHKIGLHFPTGVVEAFYLF